jgi:hypothetical protein
MGDARLAVMRPVLGPRVATFAMLAIAAGCCPRASLSGTGAVAGLPVAPVVHASPVVVRLTLRRAAMPLVPADTVPIDEPGIVERNPYGR